MSVNITQGFDMFMKLQEFYDKVFSLNPAYNRKIRKWLIAHTALSENELWIIQGLDNYKTNKHLEINPSSTFLIASNYPILSSDFDLSALMYTTRFHIDMYYTRYSIDDIEQAKNEKMKYQYEFFISTSTYIPVDINYHFSNLNKIHNRS